MNARTRSQTQSPSDRESKLRRSLVVLQSALATPYSTAVADCATDTCALHGHAPCALSLRSRALVVETTVSNSPLSTYDRAKYLSAGVLTWKTNCGREQYRGRVKHGVVRYLLRPPTHNVALPTRGISCATNSSRESSVSLPLTSSKSGICT